MARKCLFLFLQTRSFEPFQFRTFQNGGRIGDKLTAGSSFRAVCLHVWNSNANGVAMFVHMGMLACHVELVVESLLGTDNVV